MAYDGELKFDTRIDKTGFKLGLSSLGNLASQGMAVVTSAVSAAAGTVAALGTAAVNVGIEFESAFAGVKKTVDATDAQLDTLKTGIIDMSERIPETAANIASVAEVAGQLGIATEDILGFTETMINLGVATNLTADEAASSLAKFANITGMSAENYDNLGSTIVALGNNFATTEADIVAMSTRLASAGSVVGLSEAQILAISTALSSVGIEAEAGGSAISTLLKDIETAAKGYNTANSVIQSTGMSLRELTMLADADSSAFKGIAQELGYTSTELKNYMSSAKDLESFADVAGVSAQEFIDAWGHDAVQALDMFVTGLSDTERLGKSSVEILGEMGINEIRLSNAVLALSESGGILTESVQLANDAWDENTALAKEAEQRYETLESKITMMKNSASALGIAVYEEIQEPLRNLADLGTDYLSRLSTAFEVGGFQALASALGAVLSDAISKITQAAPKLVEAGTIVLNSFVSGILRNTSSIASAASSILTSLLDSLFVLAPQIISAGIELCTALASGIAESAPELVEAANSGIEQVLTAITENLPEFVDSAFKIISAMISGFISSIPEIVNAAVLIIETLASGLADNIGYIVSSAIAIISALCTQLLTTENIEKLMKAAYDILISITTAILDNLDELIAVALNVITFLCTELISSDNIQTLIETGLEILLAIVDAIVDNSDELISAALTVITTLVDELLKQENLEKLISAGAELLVQIIIGLCQLAGKFNGFVNELFIEISTAIAEIDWASIGISIVEGICSGLLDVDFKMDEYLGDFADNWVTGVKDIFDIHSPSRLMREVIGKPLAEGVGVGFVDNMPDVEQDALAAFESLSKTVSNYTFTPNVDTAGIINSTDDHSTGDTTITEETHYHIYTQASNASDAAEIAEELEFLRKQEDHGKGK